MALIFLIVVISTNYSMIFFTCHGLHVYGAWLKKYHKADLWLLRVLVSMTHVQYLHYKECMLRFYVSILLTCKLLGCV